MKYMLKLLLTVHLCISKCSGFGRAGHYVLGESVSRLVANKTLDWVTGRSFFNQFNDSWGLASIAADGFRSRPGLAWTGVYHYYGPDDDPPTHCPGVQGWNTTKGGNLIKGIERFTNLLVNGKGGSFSALFVLHLLQDIIPTHVSHKARGGNDVIVEYNGHRVNLHRLYDSVLVQELADRAGGTRALIKNIVKAARPRSLRECPANDHWNGSFWMNKVVAKANKIHMLNCKVVWRDELRKPEILLPIMHELLVDGAVFSACHWDRVAALAVAGDFQKDEQHSADVKLVVQT